MKLRQKKYQEIRFEDLGDVLCIIQGGSGLFSSESSIHIEKESIDAFCKRLMLLKKEMKS